MSNDEISQMIVDCENRESKLSDWERKFIQSVSERAGNGLHLTTMQVSTLESIWERIT